MSPFKRITFTLIALVGMPALFFLLIELGLRAVGFGTSYSYFNKIEIDGEQYFQDNKSFANQFYPPSLGIAPVNNTLKAENTDDVIRVYILGGSAAQGFPHINHGLDRHLSAHLRAALPGKTIEVINTAMTSVNSHVVYEVARTLPANSADYAIILMGNNEVVGPYGPSTFEQNFISSLPIIRILQALKRTRTWQAVDHLIHSFRPAAEKQELEWEGMQMFSEFTVTHDDPRLADVYSHYQNNLQDIIDMLQDKGMHVILSSVPVNLRHSAPFGSAHRSDISEQELTQWKALNERADTLFTQQDWQASVTAYRNLLAIDDEYASSHFNLATALESLGDYETAKQHYELALHYDTRRFRTNRTQNEVIKAVASNEGRQNFTFVDNAAVFDEVSAPFAPGWNLLHEHVHFDFDGNYFLAREFTQAIIADLNATQSYRPLSQAQAAALIGFPNHETNQVMNRLLSMVSKPPFTHQSNSDELIEFTTARRDDIVAQVGRPADVVKRRQSLLKQGQADWKIHYELAELNRFLRNDEAVYYHLSELVKLYPHNHESHIKLAEYLSSAGKYKEAITYLEKSLAYTRNDTTKVTQALGWIGLNHMKLNDYQAGKDALEQIIDEYPDQIGATMRAYGVLVKYAKDMRNTNDLKTYIAAVQRYAKRLINDERAEEFPLLYRRMAQIMTIAGDNAAAKQWQSMQPVNRN